MKIRNVNLLEKEHQNEPIAAFIIFVKMMMQNAYLQLLISVTLYGQDPDYRPDIYGKIGNSGVNVCTLDDMKKLYDGFDLCHPSTSVSMTINGPAPIILAMFMNTAIDQQVMKFVEKNWRQPSEEEFAEIKEWTLQTVRGTVQADILKEDQGQNTCIFSTEFALKMMGDIQQYFIDHKVRNYYSVSISWLSYCRSRSESDFSIGFYIGEWIYVC